MSADKAARLAAIRAANARKEVAPTVSSRPSTPEPKSPATNSAPASPLLTWGLRVIFALLFGVVGGLLVVTLLELWGPIVHYALPDIEATAMGSWQPASIEGLPAFATNTPLSLSRASAMVSYVLLWLAMAIGLAISGRAVRVWPGVNVSSDLHQHLSLLGLLFALFHVLILLADPALDFTLSRALLPWMGASYRPMWVGLLGKAALYLMVLVWASFYLRKRLGGRWWRRIHYLSFAVFVLALLHGVFAGTDSAAGWVEVLYGLSGASLVMLAIYRIVSTRRAIASEVGQLQAGALTLDPITRTVTLANARKVALHAIEARLLYYLMQNEGQVIMIDQILTKVWGRHYLGKTHLVAGYIRRLRTKIEPNPAQPAYIRSVHDHGYQFYGRPPLVIPQLAERAA
jgi:DNA-binding winged helix-turn-helix (wHTH) protein/DMSO/TMAO reductase YedYZ heme-binding membrane subunit